MLNLLEKLASKLQYFRKISLLLAFFLLLSIVIQLTLFPAQPLTSDYTQMCFVCFIWLLLFNILLSVFYDIPNSCQADMIGFKRIKVKFQRFLYHLLAFLFICLTVVIMFLTVRFFRI